MAELFKLGYLSGDEEFQYRHADTFETEKTSGPDRLAIGSRQPLALLWQLVEALLSPKVLVLYVLHTSRCDVALARYQSPPLELEQLHRFTKEFGNFLSYDGRHDLWIHSPESKATLVWDRHDVIRAYGPLASFRSVLKSQGLRGSEAEIPTPHVHHYHPHYDQDELRMIAYYEWRSSPLHPEDEQF